MSNVDNIVNLNITRGTRAVSRAGFGTALILSDDATHSGDIAVYNSIGAVEAAEGTSSATYRAAARLFGQDLKPTTIKVAKRTAKVAQVITFTIDDITDGNKTITINGIEFTYVASSNTADEIRDALFALINAGAEPVTGAAGGAGALTVTADVAGNSFTYIAGAGITAVETTASNGAVEDLAAANQADFDWFALVLTSRNADDIFNAAGYMETQRKIFAACSEDADVLTSVTTDIASRLKAAGFDNTFYFWSDDQENYPEAGWLGSRLPRDPGSQTWIYKAIRGITVSDSLTDTQIAELEKKNASYYLTTGGVAVTLGAKVASGEWIDVIRFQYFLHARMTEKVFSVLINTDKVEFTDIGIAQIEAAVRESLELGERVRGLTDNPKYTVTVPQSIDVSSQDKLDRTLRDVSWQASLAGAIHKTDISGTVSV